MQSSLTSMNYNNKDTSNVNNKNDSSGIKLGNFNFDPMYINLFLGLGSESVNKYKDEYPGEADDTSSTGGFSTRSNFSSYHQNSELRRPPSPNLAKKTIKIVNFLHKLTWFQHQDEIIRFLYRTNVTHSPFTDCCLTTLIPIEDIPIENGKREGSGESKNKKPGSSNSNTKDKQAKAKRVVASIGPFLSCPGRHDRGPDYEVFPWFMKPSEASLKKMQQLTTLEAAIAVPKSRPLSSVQSDLKCRHCPRTSIGGIDSDGVYEDYKSTITYGKIDKNYQKKFIERYEAFLDAGNAESSRPGSAKGKQVPSRANFDRDNFSEAVAPITLPFHTPMNQTSEDQQSGTKILYGPAAIASVSGYNFKKKNNHPHPVQATIKPTLNISMPKKPIEVQEPHKQQNPIRIPFPPDNVRYYDDDVDPEIVEHLNNAPLTFGPDAGRSQGLPNMANGSFSKIISAQDPRTVIYEYTISSARLENNPNSPRFRKKPTTARRQKTVVHDPTKDKLVRTNEGSTPRKKKAIKVRNSIPLSTNSKIPESGRKLKEAKPLATARLIKEIKQKDDSKRNPERESKTRPISVRVSPRRPPAILVSPRQVKSKVLSKKKSNSSRRFSQSISTVKLPTPKTKYSSRLVLD